MNQLYQHKSAVLIILGVIVVLVLLGILLYTNKKAQLYPERAERVEGPAALQEGPAPLTEGKQTYTILTDKPSDYQIMQVDVDPLDVKQGETQTVTITVKDAKNNPITKENKVQGTVFTDLKTTNFTASLVQAGGPALSEVEGPDLTMLWQGSWELQDTTDQRYMITIRAESAESSSKVDLSFR